jgi:hypothetical protein
MTAICVLLTRRMLAKAVHSRATFSKPRFTSSRGGILGVFFGFCRHSAVIASSARHQAKFKKNILRTKNK